MSKELQENEYADIIGLEVWWVGNKDKKSPIKEVRKLDSGKEIAIMESGAVISLDILRDEKGKYIAEDYFGKKKS